MGREARENRVLITGMRRSGESEYDIRIRGEAPTRFPPLQVRMTLGDLRSWLQQMRPLPDTDPTARPAPLRIVG